MKVVKSIFRRNTIKHFFVIFYFFLFIQEITAESIILSKRIELKNSKIIVISNPKIKNQPTIGLALSGGGSRGTAHIGVLKYIEKHQIPIDFIAGTSIGSFVGGLYAAGYDPEQIEEIFKTIDWNTIFSDKTERTSLFMEQKAEYDRYLLSIGFKGLKPYIPDALTPGQKLLNIITELFIKAPYQVKNSFDDLKIPFRVVATDIISGKMVILKDGSLPESINASMVIPLLFSPVAIDSLLLVDGGLVNNLPVDVVSDMGADIVIASDMSAVLRKKNELNLPWEIADQVTTIMSKTCYEWKKRNADILIRPQISGINNTDFSQIGELIDAGEKAAQAEILVLDEFINSPSTKNKLSKWLISSVDVPEEVKAEQWIQRGDSLSYYNIDTFLDSLIKTGWYKKVTAIIDTTHGKANIKISSEFCAVLKNINLIGVHTVDLQILKNNISLQIGARINVDSLKSDLKRIRNIYYEHNNTLMQFTDIQIDSERGILSIYIDEGLIEKIEISGNERTKKYVIQREFRAVENRVFDWKVVNRGVQNVYSSGLFERVGINVVKKNNKYILRVNVKEKSHYRMKIGGKIDNDRKSQLYLALTDQNFLGNGIKTTLIGRFGTLDDFYGISIRNDRIFKTYLTINALGYYSAEINPFFMDGQTIGQYSEKRTGIKLQLGFQLFRLGQIIGEFRVENVEDKAYSGDFNKKRILDLHTISFKSITDGRNKRAFPTNGAYFYWLFESGSDILLNSQEGYTKAMIHLERYLSFKSIHTWHGRAHLGIGDKTLPFSENFRMGGIDNFYGYWKNELYGKQMLLLSMEYRLKIPLGIFKETYLSMRYDLGGIWQEPTLLLTTADMEAAFGACIGFNTFLGPLKFAFGRTLAGKEIGYLSFGFNF